MATKTAAELAEEKKNEALDAEIFKMFSDAEAELVEEGVERPPPEGSPEAAALAEHEAQGGRNPDALTDEQLRAFQKLNGVSQPTAVPTGTPSKVSPSMQRFNLQVPPKKKD